MNRIDTTQIIDPGVLQPLTGPSLKFLQDSSKEMIGAICKGLIGNNYVPNVPYAMWGMAYNGTPASPTDIGDGYIFFNGELYFCGGLSPIVTGAIFTIAVTNDPVADPVTFTDLSIKNVHNLRRIIVSDVASSPIFPQFTLANVVYVGSNHEKTQITPAPLTTASAAVTPITGATFTSDGTKKYKVTLSGTMNYATSGGITEGGEVTILNQTTSTVLAVQNSFHTTSIGAVRSPFNIVVLTSALPSATVLIANIQRIGTNNVTVDNMKWIIEEY